MDGETFNFDYVMYDLDTQCFYAQPIGESEWVPVVWDSFPITLRMQGFRKPGKKIRFAHAGYAATCEVRPGCIDLSVVDMVVPPRFHDEFYCVRNSIAGVICGPDGFANQTLVNEICIVFDQPKVRTPAWEVGDPRADTGIAHGAGEPAAHVQPGAEVSEDQLRARADGVTRVVGGIGKEAERVGARADQGALPAARLALARSEVADARARSQGLFVALLLDGQGQGVHMVGIDCGRKLLWELNSERYALRLCERAFWRVCQPLGGYIGIRRMYRVMYDPKRDMNEIVCRNRAAAVERMRLDPTLRRRLLKNYVEV